MSALSPLKELSDALSRHDIQQLHDSLSLPDGVCDRDSDGALFFLALQKWNKFDPFIFHNSLLAIRPDLVGVALNISWLCIDVPGMYSNQPLTVKGLVQLLQCGISNKDLHLIHTAYESEESEMKFDNTMKLLLRNNVLRKDLIELSLLLLDIELGTIAEKLDAYRKAFQNMCDHEFISKFRKELARLGKQIIGGEHYLKEFLERQFRNVKQMLSKDDAVNLEKVYVDLTILKQKSIYFCYHDETTYNEIAYLRKIANKEVDITPIDFMEEMKSCDQSKPEIKCIIGTSGSGKTFLCNRTALTLGNDELSQFSYLLCIPCRKQEWNKMESSRVEAGLPITFDFICEWLLLGLPVGPSWTTDLAKHITETDGEGLLLIIDGLDEFPNDVPFQKTLLYFLLARKALTRSFILLTSRPGAWADISISHELTFYRVLGFSGILITFYRVLGFSPAQRDLYFKKQFDDDAIVQRCIRLLDRHDEIKQLSLIPANASLFAALLKSEDGACIHSLTRLYYELTLYLIRRQLTRMRLEELPKVSKLSELDSNVLECLHSIGFIAYKGVAMREMIFAKKVPLRVGKVLKSSECLGLVQEYVKVDKMGIFTKVWSFGHLTIQEFIGAIWLKSTSWRDQCVFVRFLVHTNCVFSVFRMVLRFLCGLLSNESMNVFYLLYKHVIPRTVPIHHLPECVQLRYEGSYYHSLFHFTGWEEFTEKYLQLNEMLSESDCDSIPNFFQVCRRFLPDSVCFYIESAVTPNEWICFLDSLPLFEHIHLIYLDFNYITPKQLFDLFECIRQCSVSCVSLKLYHKSTTEVLDYANAIQRTQLTNTKLCLELDWCILTETEPVKALSTCSANQMLSGLSLYGNDFPPDTLSLLTNHISTCYYLSYSHSNTSEYEVLLSRLSSATHINGLHLYDIPTEHHQRLYSLLPSLPNLGEITWCNADNSYSILPYISHLFTLSYLHLQCYQSTYDSNLSNSLLQLLHSNKHSIRVLKLYSLEEITFYCLNGFFGCLQSCTNLVKLELAYTSISCDDVTLWRSAVHSLTSLLHLNLYHVSLSDSGMWSLCRGLLFHPTIRSLEAISCQLSSNSCFPLTNLIPTLEQLKYLRVTELSKPNPEPIKLLELTAVMYLVVHKLH